MTRSKIQRALAQVITAWVFLCLLIPMGIALVLLQLRERSKFTRSRAYRRLCAD